MVTILIGMMLAFIAGFFVSIKSVQLGLRWNLQTQQKQEPTMATPIKEVVDNKHVEKVNQETANVVDEWLNGPKAR